MTQTMARIGSFLQPILFAAFPLLSLFEQNQSEVELSVLWVPLILCVVAGAALFGLFWLITRRATKAGALASLVVVGFFYYGVASENLSGLGLSDWVFFALWVALLGAAGLAIARTRRSLVSLALIVSVGAAVLALPAAAKVAAYQSDHPAIAISDPRIWPTSLPKPTPASGTPRPDIYFIVPDDYPRPDVLRKYFHYDDGPFIRQLEARGFALSPQSRSPYSDSESNISAALNMDYLSGLPRILGAKSQDVRPVKRLIEDNRASQLLKTLGYLYLHLDTDEVTFGGSNPHISPLAPPDSFENLWLQKSVLRLIGGPIGFNQAAMNERFRHSIRSQFSALNRLPQTAGPKFVVFHTLLPHDPYVLSAAGKAVTFPSQSEDDLGSRLGMRYFQQQVQYVNRQLLETVDTILAHSKTRPIIVIQADEGFQANSETFGEPAALDIRVKGLIASYLPGLKGSHVAQPPNTVNTLRFVFNRYFGTHYKLLKSASYPEGDFPYEFQEKLRVK
ncbi:MAG: hypothetical protein QOG26_801 [Solirubrobacterales bacterium]|nr:hypothetical protein [Solirubrobacterales bacterium]